MENEYEILINVVELASELASERLQYQWDYRDGEIHVNDGHGGGMYLIHCWNYFKAEAKD